MLVITALPTNVIQWHARSAAKLQTLSEAHFPQALQGHSLVSAQQLRSKTPEAKQEKGCWIAFLFGNSLSHERYFSIQNCSQMLTYFLFWKWSPAVRQNIPLASYWCYLYLYVSVNYLSFYLSVVLLDCTQYDDKVHSSKTCPVLTEYLKFQ